jgi:hypothetical protein
MHVRHIIVFHVNLTAGKNYLKAERSIWDCVNSKRHRVNKFAVIAFVVASKFLADPAFKARAI